MDAVLQATRRQGDEAQWTRIIAAVAGSDANFARELASLFIAEAPRASAAQSLRDPPADLLCRCERSVVADDGSNLGRVDLVFEDRGGTYFLLVEHKLGSDYGHRQLERYTDAVRARTASCKGLIAVTATTPLQGEAAIADDPFWLGSLRWWRLFGKLRALRHEDQVVTTIWQASLDLLRAQGDFGPMDATPDLAHEWARRDKAERMLFGLLRELVEPTIAAFTRDAKVPGAAIMYRGKKDKVVVWPHRNRPHLKFGIPASAPDERLWVQFYAGRNGPVFSVEARYQHPKIALGDDQAVMRATDRLRELRFNCSTDGSGHHWSWHVPVDVVIDGAESHERLVAVIENAAHKFIESGLFEALSARDARHRPSHDKWRA